MNDKEMLREIGRQVTALRESIEKGGQDSLQRAQALEVSVSIALSESARDLRGFLESISDDRNLFKHLYFYGYPVSLTQVSSEHEYRHVDFLGMDRPDKIRRRVGNRYTINMEIYDE